MAGKVTLGEVARGDVDLILLQKLNSLLDMQRAAEMRDMDRVEKARRR